MPGQGRGRRARCPAGFDKAFEIAHEPMSGFSPLQEQNPSGPITSRGNPARRARPLLEPPSTEPAPLKDPSQGLEVTLRLEPAPFKC